LGSDVRRNATGVHGRIGYVPSTADLWPSLTGAETLRFLGNVHGSLDENYRNELVERFGLEVDKLVRALSHGNRQKLLLIAAFARRPDLLILDEPTSGLDPLMSQVFQECIHEASDRGQTVLLSSHILSEVDAVCDRVAMLRRGRLIETLDLSTMRNLASTRVEAVLSHAMPLEVVQTLDSIPGVSGASIDDLRVRCVVNGPIGALLDTLLPYGVERLWTTEPSLEEMFVSRYDEPDSTPTPSAT
ncbi:MAG TPA: ABC transporter ATP-binding protein, partial [Microthrixaceae bacterium]|nr:ABC transporter ATP-binding protein [Microthrixaceae bacterium]